MSTKNIDLYDFLYNHGSLTLKELFDKVTNKEINKHDFHWITSLSYEGIKKEWGW